MLTFIWKTVQLSLSLFEMHYLFASGKKRIGFASNSSAFSASTSVSVLLACVHLHCLCDSTLASHRVWTLTTLNIYSIIAKSRGACQKNICLGFFWLVPTLWRGAFPPFVSWQSLLRIIFLTCKSWHILCLLPFPSICSQKSHRLFKH